MNKSTFKAGQKYGNDLTLEVIKRTAKTATIKTSFGTQRIKISEYNDFNEVINFKCWQILASEEFNAKESLEIALDKAYYS
tara:strand:+ start:2081 stop:2323 length:243 start_codon:yes stop_codon:yes gene_type:complete